MFELIPFDRHIRRMANFDPFRDLEAMERSFWGNENSVCAFRADVLDKGDAYELHAELPGFKKEDIKIDVENDVLTISAERKYDSGDEAEKAEKPNFVKRERFYGAYSRSFDVSGIDVDGITAAYTDGVLQLTMPKKVEAAPAKRSLEIQ